jgi:hypothetical protein
MELTEKQIEEIAEYLELGFKCYYNLKSDKIVTIPDFDSWCSDNEEFWDDVIKELEENWDDFYEFERVESRISYRFMADFAESLDDTKLQDKLIKALNRPKPFRNFKWEIDDSGEYRQQWFDFKKSCFIQWVKDQIEAYNNRYID